METIYPLYETQEATELTTEYFKFTIYKDQYHNQQCRHIKVKPLSEHATVMDLAIYLKKNKFKPTFIGANTIQVKASDDLEEKLKAFKVRRIDYCVIILLIMFEIASVIDFIREFSRD